MKRSMRYLSLITLVAGLFIGMSGDVFAKGMSSSRSSSSSFSKSSSTRSSGGGFGFSKSTKPTTGTVKTTPKVTTTTKTSTPKAVAPKTGGGFGSSKKVDTGSAKYKSVNSKITKDFGTSTKKYKSKDAAKADLTSKMATKTYDYKDPKVALANRPDNIPQSCNGRPTAYYGGHYGYYDPMGSFITYTAANMIVTDMHLRSYAPHMYTDSYSYRSSVVIFWVILGFIGVIGLILSFNRS
jgi:hypothetical protein